MGARLRVSYMRLTLTSSGADPPVSSPVVKRDTLRDSVPAGVLSAIPFVTYNLTPLDAITIVIRFFISRTPRVACHIQRLYKGIIRPGLVGVSGTSACLSCVSICAGHHRDRLVFVRRDITRTNGPYRLFDTLG
jgi:hypothetical protein